MRHECRIQWLLASNIPFLDFQEPALLLRERHEGLLGEAMCSTGNADLNSREIVPADMVKTRVAFKNPRACRIYLL